MRHTRLSLLVLIGLVCLLWSLPSAAQDSNNTVLVPTTQDDGTTSYFEAQLLTAVGTAGDTPFGILMDVPAEITQTKLHLNEAMLTMSGGTLMLWRGELFADVNDLQAAIENGIDLTSKRRPDRWEVDVIRGVAMVELAGQEGTAVVVVAGGSVTYGQGALELTTQSAQNNFNAAGIVGALGHDNTKAPLTAGQLATIKDAQPLLKEVKDVKKAGIIADILLGKEPLFNIDMGKADKDHGKQTHLINYLLDEAGLTTKRLTEIVEGHPRTARVIMDNIRQDSGAVPALREEAKDNPGVMDVLVGISKSDPRAVDTAIQVAVGDKGSVDRLLTTLKADEEAGDIFKDRLSNPGTQQVVIESILEWVVDDPAVFYLPYFFAELIAFSPVEGMHFMIDVLSDGSLGEYSIWMVGEAAYYNEDILPSLIDEALTDPDAENLLVDSLLVDEGMADQMRRLAEEDSQEGQAARDFLDRHPDVFDAIYGVQPWEEPASTNEAVPVATAEPTLTPEATQSPIEETSTTESQGAAPTASPTPSPTPAPDADSDTIPDTTDNCPSVANTGQQNADGDTLGDACDPDLAGTTGADAIDITTSGGGTLNSVAYTGATNINADAGNDTISIQGGGSLSGTLDGGADVDTIDLSSTVGLLTLNSANGGTANSTTFVNVEQVTLGGSNDSITVNAGGSLGTTINAGGGSDTLSLGTSSSPVVTVTGATTTMNVSVNNGAITTVNNVESIVGSSSTDNITLTGTGGANTAGSLVVDGAGGSNAITVATGITGYWTLSGNAGYLDFGSQSTGVTVNLSNTASHQDIFGNGSFFLWIQGTVSQLFGGSGNDTLTGSDGDDTIDGGAGSDTINGGMGDDTLNGSAGLDTIHGGAGNDTINGGDDIDTLYGDAGNDTINGDAGNDLLDGGADNDTLNAGDGQDTLYGGAGNDTVDGGDDIDVVYGGINGTGDDGSDIINDSDAFAENLYGGNRHDTAVTGNDVGDTFNINGAGSNIVYGGNKNAAVGSSGNDGDDTINLNTGSTSTTVYGGNNNAQGTGNDGNDTINDNNNTYNTVYGGNSNNTAACNGTNCNDGSDTINDTAADTVSDTYYGGNDNTAGIGNDTGAADTFTSTTSPDDTIYTGNRNAGGSGADTNGGTVSGGDDTEGGNNP